MDPHQVQQQLLQKYSQQGHPVSSPLEAPSPSQSSNPNLFHPGRQLPPQSAQHPPRHVDPRESGQHPQLYGNEDYRDHVRRQSIHAAIAAVPSIFTQPQGPSANSPSSGPMHMYSHSYQGQHLPHHPAASGLSHLAQASLDSSVMHPNGQSPHSMDGQSPTVLTPVSNDGLLDGTIIKTEPKAVITTGVSGAIGTTPARDGEGKFPCPNCNKTYLHAKHLKRHLLRHTGDRPYQCVICKDTFSRSDILKRHFQKCTLRNGNPTGASHLAYSDQHKSRKAAAAANAVLAAKGMLPARRASREVLTVQLSPCTNCASEGLQCSKGTPCEQCSKAGKQCKSAYVRRTASNLRGSLPPVDFGSFAEVTPDQQHMAKGYGPPYDFHHSGAHDQSHIGNFSSSAPTQAPIHGSDRHAAEDPSQKYDWDMFFGETTEPKPDRQYDLPENFAVDLMYSYWPPFTSDVLEERCERIVERLHSMLPTTPMDVESPSSATSVGLLDLDELKSFFQVESVRKYFRGFSLHFLAHFPLIHLPTFNISNATDSLIMTIVCMGAVYDSNEIEKVRRLMDVCISFITAREMELLRAQTSPQSEGYLSDMSQTMFEDILASTLVHILMTWHGSARQRSNARRTFSQVVELAKMAHLFEPLGPRSPGYSPLHQLNAVDESEWDWKNWVQQELRNRLMLAIYLLDTAFVIYFSTRPIMESAPKVNVTLPADDAAFEAKTSEECAAILGVRDAKAELGTPLARRKQPAFQDAIQQLMNPALQFPSGTTNAYGKFILVHAIHVKIWTEQDHHYRAGTFAAQIQRPMFTRQATEWKPHAHHAPVSHLPGVRRNSVSAPAGPNQKEYIDYMQRINRALEKWKAAWDADVKTEFPDPSKRIGFCRDGLPFYWLAKVFIKHGANPEWRRGKDDDDTLAKVQKLLKKVNDIISKEAPGFDMHGAVASIDETYAMDDLTFDMKLLFTPISTEDETPEATAET